MTADIDQLQDLARTATPPALDHVLARGAQLHRRRRRTRVAAATGAGLTGAALAAVAVLTVGGDDRRGTEVAGPLEAPAMAGPPGLEPEDCGGYAESRPPEDADGLRYLPAWLPDGMAVDAAWARAEILTRETCPRVPVTFNAAEVDAEGVVRRSVRLHGPSPEPYPAPDHPRRRDPVRVRGATGEVVTSPTIEGELELRWTDERDRTWLLASAGLSEDELLRVAEDLRIPDETGMVAQAGWLPDGLQVLFEQPAGMAPLPPEQRWWHAVVDDGARFSLDVAENVPDQPPVGRLMAGDRLVAVRGRQGVTFTNGCPPDEAECQRWLSWEEEPGVVVTLSGSLSLDTLVRIAESLEEVAPDDARIQTPDG